MPEDMEFYVSPEFADTVGSGTVVTFVVVGKEKIQSGVLLKATGQVISGKIDEVQEIKETTAVPPTAPPAPPVEKPLESAPPDKPEIDPEPDGCVDLTSPPRAVSSFTGPQYAPENDNLVKEASEKTDLEPVVTPSEPEESVEPVVSKTGLSFGARGPELVGVEGEVAVADLPPTEDVPLVPPGVVVASKEEFYQFLGSIDVNDPAHQVPDQPLTRNEAVEQESAGSLAYSGAQMYISNKAPGQLVLSDIGVRMRYGDAYDLSRIPAVALKSSSDLFEAIANNLVAFVSREEMMKISGKNEKRLNREFSRRDGLDVYDKADDVIDDIWRDNDYDDDDDYEDRRRPQRRERFSRGSGSRHDDEVDMLNRASVNKTPTRFRDVRSEDILRKGDNELDRIDRDVKHREVELGVGGEDGAPSGAIDDVYDDYGFANGGREPEARRSGGSEDHVTVARRDW